MDRNRPAGLRHHGRGIQSRHQQASRSGIVQDRLHPLSQFQFQLIDSGDLCQARLYSAHAVFAAARKLTRGWRVNRGQDEWKVRGRSPMLQAMSLKITTWNI